MRGRAIVADLAHRLVYHSLRSSHLFWLWQLLVILYIRLRMPSLVPHPPILSPAAPSVDIVLPVRDEGRNIRDSLHSLLAQDYPRFRVIVVDDASQDHTLLLARSVAVSTDRLTVVEGLPLPSGWAGKSWASHQGATRGDGEWILFTDADVRFHPQTLAQAVRTARADGADLLSVLQRLECHGFWEQLLQPVFMQFVLGVRPPFCVQSPWFRTAYATGQFILIRRAVYERLGGYEAVRGEIADDVALAALVKRAGCRLRLANAVRVVDVRMYHGLGEIWAGWRKGLYPASGNKPLLAVATVFLLTTTSVLPVLTVLARLLGMRRAPARPALLSLLLMVLARATGDVTLRASPRYGWIHPLAAIVLCANYLASMLRHYSGKGQTWKGRTYGRATTDR